MADSSSAPTETTSASVPERTPQNDRSGGGSGRRGRGGKGSGPMPREVRVSMALSKLLRHKATSAGITLDAEGFAELDKVSISTNTPLPSQQLAWPPLKSEKTTVQDVKDCTRDNAKQRFTMKPNPATNPHAAADNSSDATHWLIRANQGHSIALESSALLTEITPATLPPRVLHGTYFAFWRAIVAAGGLKRMTRNHVHCATGVPGTDDGVVSGMRKDAEILIEIDAEAALRDGAMKWWMSSNGVVLTEGDQDGLVPLRYFRRAEGVKAGVGVLMENGEVVAELPTDLQIRAPRGKNHGKGGRR
ncbi:hypothetical protein TD95_001897 [Thielaviopsis punctulata]|uniref:2'-phosphotransferase n=1 Tax=Thielaviopsis punctulata TaxID=72032 RepID=A0A0F4ZJ36_9PEZI|nr:hypothetical protein TD95_001897 [Thielaviopsis punctulata]